MRWLFPALGFLLLGAFMALPAFPAAPLANNQAPLENKRVVSLDYCADQFVLSLVAPEYIIALSPDADKSFSYLRAQALGKKKILPRVERVLALRPDVVVQSYGAVRPRALYKKAGIELVQIAPVQRLDDWPARLVEIGIKLGAEEKARALADDFMRHLASLSAPFASKRAPDATLYLTPGGVTAGQHTLIDDLFLQSRLHNFEQRQGWPYVPLERLATSPPDKIIYASFGAAHDVSAMQWGARRHPLIRDMFARLYAQGDALAVSGALTSGCHGAALLDFIHRLRAWE